MNLPPKEGRRGLRRKGTKRRVAGRILTQKVATIELEGQCWICGKRVYFWNPWGVKWHNRWWCFRHHPLHPQFRDPWARHTESTSQRDRARHEHKVDAGLGRKKRKKAKPRKRTRDRSYRR